LVLSRVKEKQCLDLVDLVLLPSGLLFGWREINIYLLSRLDEAVLPIEVERNDRTLKVLKLEKKNILGREEMVYLG